MLPDAKSKRNELIAVADVTYAADGKFTYGNDAAAFWTVCPVTSFPEVVDDGAYK